MSLLNICIDNCGLILLVCLTSPYTLQHFKHIFASKIKHLKSKQSNICSLEQKLLQGPAVRKPISANPRVNSSENIRT